MAVEKAHSANKYLRNLWLVLKEVLFSALKYCAVKGSYGIPPILCYFIFENTNCLMKSF